MSSRTLDQMLAANDLGWHGHVSAVDHQTEITVAVDRDYAPLGDAALRITRDGLGTER